MKTQHGISVVQYGKKCCGAYSSEAGCCPFDQNGNKIMTKNPNVVTPEFFIRKLDRMIESGQYVWAEDNLTGIRETIETSQKVTVGQIEAVQNISRATK